MKKSEIIEYFDNLSILARSLEIAPQAIYKWSEDSVPMLRQIQIQKLTRGKLKADMPEIKPLPKKKK